jgi:hypothetical protein
MVGICTEVTNENIQAICEAQLLDHCLVKMEDVVIISRKVVDVIPSGIISKKEFPIEEIEFQFTATHKQRWNGLLWKKSGLRYQFRLRDLDKKELNKYPCSEARIF